MQYLCFTAESIFLKDADRCGHGEILRSSSYTKRAQANLSGDTCEHCWGFGAVFFGYIVTDVAGRVTWSEQAFHSEGANLGTHTEVWFNAFNKELYQTQDGQLGFRVQHSQNN